MLPSSQYKAGVETRPDNEYGPDARTRTDRLDEGRWDDNGHSSGPTDGYESIGRSALHHPVLVGVIAVIGLLVGTAIGYKHPATYTADAQLIVGRAASLAQDQIPGLAVAEQQLAADYAPARARQPMSSPPPRPTCTLGSYPGHCPHHRSPNLRSLTSRRRPRPKQTALKLANAGAAALETVVTQVTNDNQAQVAPIVNAFQKADAQYEQATAQYNLLQHQLNTFLGELGNHPVTGAAKKYEDYLNSQDRGRIDEGGHVQARERHLLEPVLRRRAPAPGTAGNGPTDRRRHLYREQPQVLYRSSRPVGPGRRSGRRPGCSGLAG